MWEEQPGSSEAQNRSRMGKGLCGDLYALGDLVPKGLRSGEWGRADEQRAVAAIFNAGGAQCPGEVRVSRHIHLFWKSLPQDAAAGERR